MLLVIQYILMNYSTQTTMGIWISLNQVLDWSIMENGGHSEMRGAWMLLAYQHCIYLVFFGGVIAFPGKSMEHHKRRKKRRNDHNKIMCHTYPWLSFDMQNPPPKKKKHESYPILFCGIKMDEKSLYNMQHINEQVGANGSTPYGWIRLIPSGTLTVCELENHNLGKSTNWMGHFSISQTVSLSRPLNHPL